MKINKRTFIIFIIMIITLSLLSNNSYAFSPSNINKPEIDLNLAGSLKGIIGVVQIVGTAVTVGASIYLGIRYIMSSVEEKADIKKKLIPFVIGVVIFYGATAILQLIANIAAWI